MENQPSANQSGSTLRALPRHGLQLVLRHHKKAILFLAAACVLACEEMVLLQFVYPINRTLPDTQIAGSFLPLTDKSRIHSALRTLDTQSVTLVLGTKSYSFSPKDAGLTFDTPENVATVFDYPFAQRFVPFSLFFQHKNSIQNDLRPQADAQHVATYASKLIAVSSIQPVEGVITVEHGKITEQSPQPGLLFTPSEVVHTLTTLTGNLPTTVTLSGTPTRPLYSQDAVDTAALKAVTVIKPLTLTINGQQYTVPVDVVGSWLTFTPNPNTHALDIGYSGSAIQSYLSGVAKSVYHVPTSTSVTLYDGHETSRQDGTPGSYLDTTAATTQIVTALGKGSSSIRIAMTPISSPIRYTRLYSNTQAGLQALLDYLAASKGAYGISVREISERGWSASSSGSRTFITASTYKLFVSYSMLLRIESGAFQWSDSINGTDLNTCFYRMIVNSDNACSEAIGGRIGWDNIVSEIHAIGLNATYQSDTWYSTADDEALFLTKLARGQILQQSSREALINLMEQQRYRQGIPAGTGTTVADKVGFLYSLLNDAAIVYSPNSTYVLVIMTDHSSWPDIADTAKQIQAQLSR